MKKCFLFLLSLIFVADIVVPSAFALENSATSAILINADTGSVIFEKNAEERRPMASTTKIMTALILAEQNTPDKQVVVTQQMVLVEGSSMGLRAGDKVTYRDLLLGIMLSSGNDAANAAAISVSGSIESFCQLMNKRAKELGLCDTNFVTPSGLDAENHYTTAKDLAKLTVFALKNQIFADAAKTKTASVCFGNPPTVKMISNHNRLLKEYDGAIGVKTGYTSRSGRCLVSAARRNGVTLIAVTLNDKNDWADHKSMLDYGFENTKSVSFIPEIPQTVNVVGGVKDEVAISCPQIDIGISFSDSVDYCVCLPEFIYAEIKAGDVVGTVEVTLNGKFLKRYDITAENNVEIKSDYGFFSRLFGKFLILLRSI